MHLSAFLALLAAPLLFCSGSGVEIEASSLEDAVLASWDGELPPDPEHPLLDHDDLERKSTSAGEVEAAAPESRIDGTAALVPGPDVESDIVDGLPPPLPPPPPVDDLQALEAQLEQDLPYEEARRKVLAGEDLEPVHPEVAAWRWQAEVDGAKTGGVEKPTFKCSHCSKFYKYEGALRAHEDKFHGGGKKRKMSQ